MEEKFRKKSLCRRDLNRIKQGFWCYHELLLAKPNAYGLSKQTLSIIFSKLNNRKQIVKIEYKLSSQEDFIQEVLQGSELLQFNIYLHAFFSLQDANVWKFSDDTVPFAWGPNSENFWKSLEELSEYQYVGLKTTKWN